MALHRKLSEFIRLQFQKTYASEHLSNFCSSAYFGDKEEAKHIKSLHQQAFEMDKTKQRIVAGQPTPASHPHILKNGEVTAGITREEYLTRQHLLMNVLRESTKKTQHHIVILPGSPRRYMIDKIPYLYRQDTDMLYISGCLEPDCVFLMHTVPQNSSVPKFRTVMFTPPYDLSRELWDGPRTAPSAASQVWSVDEGLPVPEMPRYLTSLENELTNPNIWYHCTAPGNTEIYRSLHDWVLKRRKGILDSPKPFIHSLRRIKSPAEVELMRHTCRISAEAITATIRSCKAPVTEHQLYATVDYQCRMRGADYLAYPPVVAGGPRTNIIHYINNNNIIHPGELVLMDAGSEYRGYCADITRTWPVSGEFTPAQRDLYDAVLYVQKYVIDACSEVLSLDQLFSVMCTKLGSVLRELCILPATLGENQVSRAVYSFCPHHVSHFLGMDLHDTSTISKTTPLSPGSVITVEPGIYINEKNTAVDRRYLGLGIRIEDDILIGANGEVEVLSESCPKHPAELEAIIGKDVT